jgi:hypothetical protein
LGAFLIGKQPVLVGGAQLEAAQQQQKQQQQQQQQGIPVDLGAGAATGGAPAGDLLL